MIFQISSRILQITAGLLVVFAILLTDKSDFQSAHYSLLSVVGIISLIDAGMNTTIQQYSSRYVDEGDLLSDIYDLGLAYSILSIVVFTPIFWSAALMSDILQSKLFLYYYLYGIGSIILNFIQAYLEGTGSFNRANKLRFIQFIIIIFTALLSILLKKPHLLSLAFALSVLVPLFTLNWSFSGVTKSEIIGKLKVTYLLVKDFHLKIGLSWIFGFFSTKAFGLILLYGYGSAINGKVMLAMVFVNSVTLVVQSILNFYNVKIIRSNADAEKLNIFRHQTKITVLLNIALIIGIALTLQFLDACFNITVWRRLPNKEILIILAVYSLMQTFIMSLAQVLRSRLTEPLFGQSIIMGLVTLVTMLLIAFLKGKIFLVVISMLLSSMISVIWITIIFKKTYFASRIDTNF